MTDENKPIDDNDEDLSEPHRYDSADNWDPYKKQRKAAAKFTRDWVSEPASPFRVLNGEELAKTSARIKEPGQLFGNLWREGEVAILFGETATGKSILATQIAESIARSVSSRHASIENGKLRMENSDNSQFSTINSQLPAQPVLYLDFERTLAQFQERYSATHNRTSSRRIKYTFSKNFNRVDLGHFQDAADDMKGDLSRFLLDAAYREIINHPARVVIIDNISFLSRATGNSAGVRLMKTFKLWSAINGLSILAVAHMKDRRKTGSGFSSPFGLRRGDDASSAGWFGGVAKPITLADLPPYASLADTVFAIAHSSMAHDIRYIKHLKSLNSPPELGGVAGFSSPPGLRRGADASSAGWSADGVVVLRLARLSEPGAIATGFLNSPDSSLSSPVSSLPDPRSAIHNPQSEAPFLGLNYLGHSAEAEHLRDYEREARDAHDREQKRLRQWHRSSKEALIQGYFDGSYARYLKGK